VPCVEATKQAFRYKSTNLLINKCTGILVYWHIPLHSTESGKVEMFKTNLFDMVQPHKFLLNYKRNEYSRILSSISEINNILPDSQFNFRQSPILLFTKHIIVDSISCSFEKKSCCLLVSSLKYQKHSNRSIRLE